VPGWAIKTGAAVGAAFVAWAAPQVFDKAAHTVEGDGPPLSIAVVADPARFTSPADASTGPPLFLYDGDVKALDPPPDRGDPTRSEERWAWAHEHGAVDAIGTLIRLKISGTSSTPVILNGLRIDVEKRGPVPDSWLITYQGLGSGQGVRYFTVSLDRRPPRVKFVGKNDPFPLRVTDADVELIDVLATTLRCDCSWTVAVDWVSGSEQGTTTIDDAGEPFHTSGVRLESRGENQREIVWHSGRWMRQAPDGSTVPLE
jgi:hypothetical protein